MSSQAAEANVRSVLHNRIDSLSDLEILRVIEFIDTWENAHEPNEETIAVIRDIEAGKNLSKSYTDVKEMMKDMLADA